MNELFCIECVPYNHYIKVIVLCAVEFQFNRRQIRINT